MHHWISRGNRVTKPNTAGTAKIYALWGSVVLASLLSMVALPAMAAVDILISSLTDSPDPAPRGGVVAYTVVIDNNGDVPADGVTLTVPVPATTSYEGADVAAGDTCALAGGNVVCQLGTVVGVVNGGTEKRVVLRFKTSDTTPGTIPLQATVATTTAGDNPANNAETQNTTIDNGADLYVNITPDAPSATAGGNVTWSVSGGNNGPNASANRSISFEIPGTLSYVSAGGAGFNCSLAGNVVTCTGPGLANGATFSGLNLVTKVTGAGGGQVTVNPVITSSTLDPDSTNNSPTATVNVTIGADLSIPQLPPNPTPAISGGNVIFTLNPTNLGPDNATNGMTVTYQLPPGFAYQSAVPTGGNWGACTVDASNLVTCVNSGLFAAGRADTITITATAPTVTSKQDYNNIIATVAHNPGNPDDPVPANNSSMVNVSVFPAGAGLNLTKERAPNPVVAGAEIRSTLRVSNAGPAATEAGKVFVTDTIDTANEEFVGHEGTGWDCVEQTPALMRCTYNAALSDGAQTPPLTIVTRTKIHNPASNYVANNNAVVSCAADQQCWDTGFLAANATANVTQETDSIDLALTKSASTATLAATEDTLTYTLVLRNNTPGAGVDARDIELRDPIPGYFTSANAGTTAVNVITPVLTNTSGNSTAAFTCTAPDGEVRCSQDGGTILAPGDVVTFTIEVRRPIRDGDFKNVASAYSRTQGDLDRSNNVAEVDVEIAPVADVELVNKTLSAPSSSTQAGTQVTYVMSFRNNGPSSAAGVVMQDQFTIAPGDPGFTVVSITPSQAGITCSGLDVGMAYSAGSPTLSCNVGTLALNAARSVTLVVRPNWKSGQVADTWTIGNTARISTTTHESNTANNDKSQTLTVTAADIDLSVDNVDNVDPLGYDPSNGGDNATNDVIYTIRTANGGPSMATGVRFTYTMTPPNGKTVKFMGDSDAQAGDFAAPICTPVGATATGPAPLTLTCIYPAGQDVLEAASARNRYLKIRMLTAPETGGDTYPSRATVSANETDRNPQNDAEDELTTVRVRVDLELSKTPSLSTVSLRQPFDWTLQVTNRGPGDSALTSLQDVLPAGMEFAGSTAPSWTNTATNATGSCTTVPATRTMSCAFGMVRNAEAVTLTVPVRITTMPASGRIENCASVTTNGADPSSVNSSGICAGVDVQKSSIAGHVYGDTNNNGIKEGGEAGIPNVTVRLTGTDAYGNPVDVTVQTDSSGRYLFDNLPPSDGNGYLIEETQPDDYSDGRETIGNAGGNPDGNDRMRVVLPTNTEATGYDFAELSVSLSGGVFVDNNDDGIWNPSEPGIPGTTLTLSGTTRSGRNVCDVIPSCTVQTNAAGQWSFAGLPLSNAGGYTVTQTQPAGYQDGKDQVGNLGQIGGPVNDQFTVNLSADGAHGTGYNFGERVDSAGVASIRGHVWRDLDHDRVLSSGSAMDVPQGGWVVELLRNGQLIATEITDTNGAYAFTNIPVPAGGQDYQIRFRHPVNGLVYGQARPNEQGLSYVEGQVDSNSNPGGASNSGGALSGITLRPGDNITEHSLPLDPAGIVYDALTGAAVQGAVVRITGPAGFDPVNDLVGGAAEQTTGIDGAYQFLLNPTAPGGIYTLEILTYPSGYSPLPSTIIPVCAGTLIVDANPDPALVQTNGMAPINVANKHEPAACPANSGGFAPAGQATTQHYFSFDINNTPGPGRSANVLNNHIPLDPISNTLLRITKITPLVNVVRGDLVPYTITATSTVALTSVDVSDRLPPGFKYRSGSASANGVRVEPEVNGRDILWKNQNFTAGETKIYKLILVVGTGVGEGEYVNQAWAQRSGGIISNIGSAAVKVTPDPTFDCSDIIGKVFDDKNANGYQDQGEPGIPNVRVVTARGLLVTTDAEGRFHVTCADIPNMDRGANFVMKLDERTLPSGYRVTTENPRDVRVTRGKMVKLNFGATVHRVVRLDLNDAAFVPDSTDLQAQWQQAFADMVKQLDGRPSVLRIAYDPGGSPGDGAKLAKKRLDSVAKAARKLWKDAHNNNKDEAAFPLIIETAVEGQP
ncbi:SdrD B-like domain-containing protein [Methylobacillus sp.]|uniref:SdrD B-like domain-containing protein n=1 Tax=Methylobacillus sp. TaxID=56818 RepID=UPI002FDF7CAE